MKEVLIVMPSMKMGGAEKSLISLLNRLTPDAQKELEISVEVMVANTNGELYGEIPAFIKQVKAPADFRVFITTIKELISYKNWTVCGMLRKIQWQIEKRVCKNEKGLSENEMYWKKMSKYLKPLKKEYDVAISYMDGAASYYVVDKVLAKKKIIWVHNQIEKLNVSKIFLNEFFSKVNGIVTISDLCVESIVRIFPEYSRKVYAIPNLSDKFLIQKQSEAFFPVEFRNKKKTIILSIGRLVNQKGFDIGIEAAKVLSNRGVDFVWFIMGNGPLKNDLQQLIEKKQLHDKVILMGVRKNPYPYMKKCDIVFQPSRYEGKSIVLDEAKILMKPIVSSEYDTVYDQIENNMTGLIAKLDANDLADALERLISSESVRHRFAENLAHKMEIMPDEFEMYKPVLTGNV